MMAASHRQPAAYTPGYGHGPPSSFDFKPNSPLETLVRRTSSRRNNGRPPAVKIPSSSSSVSQNYINYKDVPGNDGGHSAMNTPPRNLDARYGSHQQLSPISPLLHSQFRPASTATESSRGDASFMAESSFMDFENDNDNDGENENEEFDDRDPRDVFVDWNSYDSRNSNLYNMYARPEEERYKYYEEEDQVDRTATALRDSWRSGVIQGHGPGRAEGRTISTSAGARRQVAEGHGYIPHYQSEDMFASSEEPPSPARPDSPVPTVVVTSPDYQTDAPRPSGKAPIVRNVVSNYSRPIRASPETTHDSEVSSSTTNFSRPRHNSSSVPVLDAEVLSSESKMRVLQRNADKGRLNGGSSPTPSSSSSYRPDPSSYMGSPSSQYAYPNYSGGSTPSSASLSPTAGPSSASSGSRSMSPSLSPMSQPQPSSSTRSRSPYNVPPPLSTTTSYHDIPLSRKPPSLRADSPVSLYSDAYSFYQLESGSTTPSPNGSGHFKVDSPMNAIPKSPLGQAHSASATSSKYEEEPLSKAQENLQLGIKHHEANRLRESAICFERSAKEDGGCGVGMLMWGLTLRHGWGCKKDEKAGFSWVRKAAEGAVADLENARVNAGQGGERASMMGLDAKGVVKAELVLAIYEVGQCFFHGWGVPKDQKMAVSYYLVAARLGDADAQNDLGFCLANGKGCKKDRKEAAKWYREAVAQGQSDVGLAWIYKEKFQ